MSKLWAKHNYENNIETELVKYDFLIQLARPEITTFVYVKKTTF